MSDGVKIFQSDDQIFLIVFEIGHKTGCVCMLCNIYHIDNVIVMCNIYPLAK